MLKLSSSELKKAVEYEMEAYPNAPVPSLITTTPIANDVGTTPSHSTDADWPQNMYEHYTGPGLAGNVPEASSQGWRARESDEFEDVGDAEEGFDYYTGAASSSGHRLSGLLNPYR
ncbi:hypothetical protein ONZ45_g14115 [Pleurotus djamor]|nr:hypothetical protein ONZ45_g14115 [Pleurotus djamor]